MNYLTNYYKNLSEQLQNKINSLQQVLLEYEDIPPGGPEPAEPVGDSNAVLSAKKFQTTNPPPPGGGPWITHDNWNNIFWMLLNMLGNPPSWWTTNYWPVEVPAGIDPILHTWGTFITEIMGAVERAGCEGAECGNNANLGPAGPERYWAVQETWARISAAANNGQPRPFPIQYQARYHPVSGSNVQIGMRDWEGSNQYNFGV